MDNVPEYYETLGVQPSASAGEIKDAYKRQSLLSHPDRFPNATPAERRKHTLRFQSVADAYYVLSDSTRRAEYDEARKARGSMPGASFFGASGDAEKEQSSSANFFRSFFGSSSSSEAEGHGPNGQPQADNVFGSVFEELLRPEVHRVAPVWSWVGAASGAGLGFIAGNIPGAIGGAVLGNRLGAIRDAKGKSVAQVFMNLGANQRAEVLKALMMKVLGSMGGGGGPGGSSGW